MILSKEHGFELAEFAVQEALKAGADEAAVEIVSFHHLYARFAKNKIIQNMEKYTATIDLAVSLGKKECMLSLSGTDKDEIRKLAKRCVENTKLFFDNEEHLPPVDRGEVQTVDAIDPEIVALTPFDIVQNLKSAVDEVKRENLEAFGTHGKYCGCRCLVNSKGTRAAYEWSKVRFSITVKTPDGMASGREEEEAFKLKHLNIMRLTERAINTARSTKNPQTVEPGDYTVILSPQAAASYIPMVLFALDARMIEEGRSVLSIKGKNGNGALNGRRIFSDNFILKSIVDHPLYPISPFNPTYSFDGLSGQGGTSELFSNGLRIEDKVYIKDGKINDMLYSYYWSIHHNRRPSGHPGLIAFEATGQPETVEQMIATTEKGIFISSFWYIRFVDMSNLLLTGLTRDGVFLIEDGKIVYPLHNFRFNESPYISLGNVQSIGEQELKRLWFQLVLMPAMKINNFTFSSISEAV